MLAYSTEINRLRIVEIREVKMEGSATKTFIFHDRLCGNAMPGRFLMVWIPRVDEVPMSLSTINPNGLSSIAVANVGEATKALHQRKPGDILGIRGPYGNGFMPSSGRIIIVGGGIGLAPLVSLAERLLDFSSKITFLLGAKTKDELLYLDRIEKALSKTDARIIVTTEDGSCGLQEIVTEPAEQILAKERFDMIYTCGPERLIHEVFLMAERYNTPLQASLERLMHCAIGLCGSCVIGRFRVCRDGPVFSREQLREVESEFGYFKRSFDGRKISL